MYGNHICFLFAQIPQMNVSVLADPLIHASRAFLKNMY